MSKKKSSNNKPMWLGQTVLVVSDIQNAISRGVQYFAKVRIGVFEYPLAIYVDGNNRMWTFRRRAKMERLDNGKWQASTEYVVDTHEVKLMEGVHFAYAPISLNEDKFANLFGNLF
jgi:hypothetical protein